MKPKIGTIVYALGFYDDLEYRRARVIGYIPDCPGDWNINVEFLEGPYVKTTVNRGPNVMRTPEEHAARCLTQ